MGRPVRVRQRRQGSAVPPRAGDSVRGRAGIPVAIGGPAYAGVPVTYPEAGDVLTFVRGHEGETDAPPDVDWARLAGIEGTIVCYAGARQIARDLQRAPRKRPLGGRTGGADLRARPRRRNSRSRARSATSPRRRRTDTPALLVIGTVTALPGTPAVVRRSPALRPPHRRHPIARAGRRVHRDARRTRRRGDSRADDSRAAAGGSHGTRSGRAPRPAHSTGSCSRAPTPSTTSCDACCRAATCAT